LAHHELVFDVVGQGPPDNRRRLSVTTLAASRPAGLLWLIASGVALAAICGWRVVVNRPHNYAAQVEVAGVTCPAPTFAGFDADHQFVRLDRYLHRHRILVMFLDDRRGVDDPMLAAVWDAAERLEQQGIQVVGVSPALPQVHRQWTRDGEPCPFPLITDWQGQVRQKWQGESGPSTAYLIHRQGTVDCVDGRLQPLDLTAFLKKALP
jgi:peroxiredoxin